MLARMRQTVRAHRALLGLYALGLVALALPLLTALYLARGYVQNAQLEETRDMAQALLDNSHAVSRQTSLVGEALQNNDTSPPCSRERRNQMRRLLVNNPLLMDIGWMQGDWLECSALDDMRHDLGPPASTSSQNRQLRSDLTHPLSVAERMLVITFNNTGYTIMVRFAQVLPNTEGKEASVRALVNRSNLQPFARVGHMESHWLEKIRNQSAMTFVDGSQIVSWAASSQWDYGVLVAVPLTSMGTQLRLMMVWLVPSIAVAIALLLLVLVKLTRHQTSLESAIRAGLKRDEFSLVYQPIVNLQSGAWVGAEALLRWHRASGEVVSPQVFIPVAESHGLIGDITSRVLELFARDAGTLFQHNREAFVALNLSTTDLCEPGTAARLQALLLHTGLDARNVHVEATESIFMDVDRAKLVLAALRDARITVAIDDFGTGYSSLSYLTRLQIDVLKIDKSFVDTIDMGSIKSQVIDHIIDLAKSLQLQMVAEGVETTAQARYLRARGVHHAQGWLFARPMSAADLAEGMLRRATPVHQVETGL